jgi:hypothetical protein
VLGGDVGQADRKTRHGFAALLALALIPPSATQGQNAPPMSAIDWLSDSVQKPLPVVLPPPAGGPATADPTEPKVATSAGSEEVVVTPLGRVSPDAAGLLPVQVTGLPRGFWGPTGAADLARLVRGTQTDMVPALQALLMQILLAEVDPPFDADARGVLFLARIDKLLDIGALDQAGALLDRAGPTQTPDIFRRAFDVALLAGTEDSACRQMGAAPALSPTYPARIFCQARNGDWETAALTLGTARALGFVSDHEDALLSRFLDPDLFEGEPLPEMPGPMTPLNFRIYEAIGEAQPTGALPRAFATSDLRTTTGWKSQIDAAERLVRSGAIDANRLIALYVERRPAASGGVWSRAQAVQGLEAALAGDNRDAIGVALLAAWDAMAAADLEPALAAVFGTRLATLDLPGEAGSVAFRLAMMTPDYEAAALAHEPRDATDAFLKGVATGAPSRTAAPDPVAAAVADGFAAEGVPLRVRSLLDEGRLGEALLRAMDLVTQGAVGGMDELTDGLALLRAMGLDGVARRAALEILILDRRG